MQNKIPDITKDSQNLSVNELWLKFKSLIENGTALFIPQKQIKAKKSLPWVTHNIIKLIRKRDKLYQKMKRSGHKAELKTKFKTLKLLITNKIKQSYNQYLANILDLNENVSNGTSKFNTKKLHS